MNDENNNNNMNNMNNPYGMNNQIGNNPMNNSVGNNGEEKEQFDFVEYQKYSPENVQEPQYDYEKDVDKNNGLDELNKFYQDNYAKGPMMSSTTKTIFLVIGVILFVIIIGAILIFAFAGNNNPEEGNNTNTSTQAKISPEVEKARTVVDNTILENTNNQKLDRRYGRIEVVWLDMDNNIIETPLEPKLNGLTPIKYEASKSGFVKTDIYDMNWYDYSEKNWANAMDENGSYFVWIPRFAYKITYYRTSSYTEEIGYLDARGFLKLENSGDLTLIESPVAGLKEAGNHYIVHPVFMQDTSSGYKNGGWDIDIPGFWTSKFEMSMEENGVHIETENELLGNVQVTDTIKAVSKPSVTSWRNINVGNAYYNSYMYNRDLESHLMKNTEWGAIAYLTVSKYGYANNLVSINKNQKYITGGSKTPTEVFNYYGIESTTGNATGVYDLVGSAWEYVAAFINNGYPRMQEFGGKDENYLTENYKNTKYKTVYSNNQSDDGKGKYNKTMATLNYESNYNKRGDATYETSNSGYGSDSFNSNSSFFMQEDIPFMIRGGDFASNTAAGVFAYNATSGQTNASNTFRVVLVCE